MQHQSAMCTIVAKNYLANARTLCQSFRALHPDYKSYVLIVDDMEGFLEPSREDFEILSLADLCIENVPSFCFRYNVTELCTAAKPFLLERLISQFHIGKLLYIDPDILVTNRLDGLYDRLDQFDIVLTPHTNIDFPDDGLLPDDSSVMKTGLFNLGFIGIRASESVESFLHWWQNKLRRKCVVDYHSGYFVDQKFMDLASVLFDNIYVEKNPGYNVAYWNLHSRRIEKKAGVWKCNDGPLYFYHFSGYQQADPNALSNHITPEEMRHHLSTRPDLHELFSEYRQLVDRNGYQSAHRWPYTYAAFSSGDPIPYEYRKIYRDNLEEFECYGNPFESPALARRLALKTVAGRETSFSKLLTYIYRKFPAVRSIYKRMTGVPA